MANTVVSVKIQLENGQYITASNEVIKATNKIENSTKKNFTALDKVGSTFSQKMKRYFSIGALFGGAFMIAYRTIGAFFGALNKGIQSAIDKNETLKNKLNDVKGSIDAAFERLGTNALPILDKLADVINRIVNPKAAGLPLGLNENELKSTLNNIRTRMQNIVKTQGEKGTQSEEFGILFAMGEEANRRLDQKAIENKKKRKEAMEKEKEAIKEANKEFMDLSDRVISLIPFQSESAEQFKKMSENVIAIADSFQKIDFSKLQLNWQDIARLGTDILGVMLSLIDATSEWIGDQIEMNAELRTSGTYVQDITDMISKYEGALTQLNIQVMEFQNMMNKEEAIRNKNIDDIDREIESKEGLIDANEKLIKANKDFVASVKEDPTQFEARLNEARLTLQKRQNELGQVEELLANDWFGNIFAGGARRETAGSLRGQINNLNAQIDLYDRLIQARDAGNSLEVENINLMNDIEDLNSERLKMEESITGEMEKQNDLLQKYIDLGVDLENIRTVKQLTKGFMAQGLQGADLGSALQNVGVENRAIAGRTLNIFGDINNTLNQASPNALISNMNNIINRIGGV